MDIMYCKFLLFMQVILILAINKKTEVKFWKN